MIISIDIGTSYSSICMLGPDGKAHPVDISTGASIFGSKYSLPSAVFVEENGGILVGQAAMNSRKHKPQNFRMEFKRNLGEDIPILLGGRSFKPEELYTELFRHMKACAEKVSGETVEKAYLTYPASYGEKRREKLRSAAKAAGLFDLELVDEPTAAAMCYCAEGYIKDGQTLLVYDFGGGTFDVSLIKYQNNGFQLLSEPTGLERCGGMDIDYLVAQDMRAAIEQEIPGAWDNLQKNQSRFLRFTSQINELAVKAKHHLSSAGVFEEYIEMGMDDVPYKLTVERLNEMIAPLIGQTLQTCRRALDEAGISASDVSAVLMVGGTSRIPLVRWIAQKITGKPALCAADLELAVAQGALVYNEYRKQEKKRQEAEARAKAQREKAEQEAAEARRKAQEAEAREKARRAAADFTIENGVLTKYKGSGGDVTIPNGVTSIGDYSFNSCTGLTSVSIPGSVKSIGIYVFAGCSNLTRIQVDPQNTAYASEDGVLFNHTKDTLIVYPAGKPGIYSLPDRVTTLMTFAFGGCSKLPAIQVSPVNASFSSVDGVLFDHSRKALIAYPAGKQGSYQIPKGVAYVKEYAFNNCQGLTMVTIPDTVTTIGDYAFQHSANLTGITIPKSVTSIRYKAFDDCPGLKNVNYTGTEEQWNNIQIREGNDTLTKAWKASAREKAQREKAEREAVEARSTSALLVKTQVNAKILERRAALEKSKEYQELLRDMEKAPNQTKLGEHRERLAGWYAYIRDYEKALQTYEEALQAHEKSISVHDWGRSRCCKEIGIYHELGRGTPQDYDKAIYWYQKNLQYCEKESEDRVFDWVQAAKQLLESAIRKKARFKNGPRSRAGASLGDLVSEFLDNDPYVIYGKAAGTFSNNSLLKLKSTLMVPSIETVLLMHDYSINNLFNSKNGKSGFILTKKGFYSREDIPFARVNFVEWSQFVKSDIEANWRATVIDCHVELGCSDMWVSLHEFLRANQ